MRARVFFGTTTEVKERISGQICEMDVLLAPTTMSSRYILRFGSNRYTLSDIHDDKAAAKLLGTLRSSSMPITPLAVDELLSPLQFNPERWPVIDIAKHSDDE